MKKRFLVILCLFTLSLWGCASNELGKKMVFIDESTGEFIGNKRVKMEASTGIVCATSPCPSSEPYHKGRTNKGGELYVRELTVWPELGIYTSIKGYQTQLSPDRIENGVYYFDLTPL